MRNFLLAAMVVGAGASISLSPTPAQARDYPFCIKGGNYDNGIGDCSFDTYEQCQATASGRDSYCDANPFYAAASRQTAANPRIRRGQY